MAKKKKQKKRVTKKYTGGHSKPFAGMDFAAAFKIHQEGQIAQAEAAYRKIVEKAPKHAQAWLYLGAIQHTKKDFHRALEYMNKARDLGLNDESYLINAGMSLYFLKRFDEAYALFSKAVEFVPNIYEPHFYMGNSCYQLKKYKEAITHLTRALELAPDNDLIRFQLACSYQDNKQYTEAKGYFEKILERNPNDPRSNCGYGMCLVRLYQYDEGLAYAQKAIDADPNNPSILYNYANVLKDAGRINDAEAYYKKAIDIKPDCIEALLGMGRMLTDCGRFEESKDYFEKVMKIDPQYYSAYSSRGISCLKNNALGAVEWFDKALDIKPDADDVWMLKGYALNILGRSQEAEQCLRKAIELNPNSAEHFQNLSNILVTQGKVADSLEAARQSLALNPTNHLVYSNILLYMHYLAQASREELWQMHSNYDKMYREKFYPKIPPQYANPRDPEKRIRVGLVSADFRRHSCAYFLDPLIRNYDRQKLEIIAYASVKTPDIFTETIKGMCTEWRDILRFSNDQAAEIIKRDRIDILIDLGGHTADNRLPIFCKKPAPVQIAWLGYPDTTGLQCMDYRITDEVCDPPGTEKFSSERLIRFQGGFHCYGAFPDSPDVEESPVLKNGYITFGSFNNFAKASEETIFLWSEILKNAPESRLLLKALGLNDDWLRGEIFKKFANHGISEDRLEILGKTSKISDHLRTYNRVDIGLDTYPYNGTTTTVEALWMGVPVISMSGCTHASLVGESLLKNVGLADLAKHTPKDFVNTAVALSQNIELLQQLRSTMRERLQSSPLRNEKFFAYKFEMAMRETWRNFCKESPVAAKIFEPAPTVPGAGSAISLNFNSTTEQNGSDGLKLNFMNLGNEQPAVVTAPSGNQVSTSPAPVQAQAPAAVQEKETSDSSGLNLNFGTTQSKPKTNAPQNDESNNSGEGLKLKF